MKPDESPSAPPPVPPAAARLFPEDRLPLVERYAALLATEGVVRGLVGPREAPRLWDRHLLNCALLVEVLPPGAAVADVGSGAGLPGLVVALARPDVRVTLVEPLLRRTTFLEEVVADLALDTVAVRRDRADALHGRSTFDVVTARAVAPLERLLGWCMPLVAPGGELVAMKGSSAEEEVVAAQGVVDRLGCAPPRVEVIGGDLADQVPPTTVVRVTWADPTRVSWPAAEGARRRPSTTGKSRARARGGKGGGRTDLPRRRGSG